MTPVGLKAVVDTEKFQADVLVAIGNGFFVMGLMAFSLFEAAVTLHVFRSTSCDTEFTFLEREEPALLGSAAEYACTPP